MLLKLIKTTVLFLNRKHYINKMKMILTDTSTFQKTQIVDSKVLTQLFHMENKAVELFKKLNEKHEISDKIYND